MHRRVGFRRPWKLLERGVHVGSQDLALFILPGVDRGFRGLGWPVCPSALEGPGTAKEEEEDDAAKEAQAGRSDCAGGGGAGSDGSRRPGTVRRSHGPSRSHIGKPMRAAGRSEGLSACPVAALALITPARCQGPDPAPGPPAGAGASAWRRPLRLATDVIMPILTSSFLDPGLPAGADAPADHGQQD